MGKGAAPCRLSVSLWGPGWLLLVVSERMVDESRLISRYTWPEE